MLAHLRSPPLILGWVALGLAIYYLSSVIDQWRKADWDETPALEMWLTTKSRPRVSRDAMGRPRGEGVENREAVAYSYAVDGTTHQGTWSGGALPPEPIMVVYDPDDPGRSALRGPPLSPLVQALGWIGLALALAVFAVRWVGRGKGARSRPEGGAAIGRADGERLPTGAERAVYRGLVFAELALFSIRQGREAAVDRIPSGVWEQIDRSLQPGPLQEMFADLYPVAVFLGPISSLGLLVFWRPARQLYVVTWSWWLADRWLAGATIQFGFDAFLMLLGRLLGGAILALSFYGPIGAAFTTRQESGSPSEDSGAH